MTSRQAPHPIKRRLRAVLKWLHLWLGLGVGLVFAIVALSGTVLAFQREILAWSQPQLTAAPLPAPDARRGALPGHLATGNARKPASERTPPLIKRDGAGEDTGDPHERLNSSPGRPSGLGRAPRHPMDLAPGVSSARYAAFNRLACPPMADRHFVGPVRPARPPGGSAPCP